MNWRERGGELAYRCYGSVFSRWARWRYRPDFERVRTFCLFVGYPRSGHSLVGAALNAHRHAVIAHEANAQDLVLNGGTRDAVYARLLARAAWFNWRGNTSNYSYQVLNQWQGRFAELQVIGDKRGGAVARSIAAHPDFLQRVRTLVGVPLRLVHVVRHPLDNISAISIWNRLSLVDSIEFYFRHCDVTAKLDALCADGEVVTIHHEQMIAEPEAVLTRVCAHLGLVPYAGYLEDCRALVFRAPTLTRRKIDWSSALVRAVEQRARAYPFLADYTYEIR